MRNLRHIEAQIRRLEADLAATDVGDRSAMELWADLKAARIEHAAVVEERLEAETFGEKRQPARTTEKEPDASTAVRLWDIAVRTQAEWLRSDAPCPLGRRIGEVP